MQLLTSPDYSKKEVFEKVSSELLQHGFVIINEEQRPWGGFFVLDDSQIKKFTDYFEFQIKPEDMAGVRLSPKILIVEKGKRLSWQYHDRRAEVWKIIGGKPGIITSFNNYENDVVELATGTYIKLMQGQRHRLIGLNDWAIVAEIWQHTNKNYPSNEEDIVRLQDDFGR